MNIFVTFNFWNEPLLYGTDCT